MSRTKLFLLVLALGVFSNSHAASIYKWVDENGVTHFGPSPLGENSSRVHLKNINGYSAPAVSDEGTAPMIIMYGASWCGICKKARNYFNANGIRYTEYDVDKDQKANREYKKLGGTGVPLFRIDGQTIRGFSQKNFDRLLASR